MIQWIHLQILYFVPTTPLLLIHFRWTFLFCLLVQCVVVSLGCRQDVRPIPISFGIEIWKSIICYVQRPQGLSDCKTKFPRYVEYWVPVGLSYVQLEKCCETLQKNSMLLCSNQKRVHDGLIDILSTIRKVVVLFCLVLFCFVLLLLLLQCCTNLFKFYY